jgi:hypothetical protein
MIKLIISRSLCLLLSILAISCIKDPVNSNNDYLMFSNATVHVANQQGSSGTVMINSNTAWHLTIADPVPDWVSINKTSGNNTQSLIITAITENTTGYYRFATIIAAPVNNSSMIPVRLTVVQYDSTDQVAHH